MALYALDDKNLLIFAPDATSFGRYSCLECRGPVRKRSGRNRRPHFCHLRNSPQCRLHSKSIDHLVLQADLKKKNPELEVERPFPSILRIADLCWEERKLVMEIQCSPISVSEAEARKRDYSQEGYDLVWLLDDRLFNKKKLKIAEERIRKAAAYFISLQRLEVYDQFEFFFDEIRLAKGPPLPVDLSLPRKTPKRDIPLRQLKERKSGYYFLGDLYDRVTRNSTFLKRLMEYEESLSKPLRKDRFYWIKKCFLLGLEYLLRKATQEHY